MKCFSTNAASSSRERRPISSRKKSHRCVPEVIFWSFLLIKQPGYLRAPQCLFSIRQRIALGIPSPRRLSLDGRCLSNKLHQLMHVALVLLHHLKGFIWELFPNIDFRMRPTNSPDFANDSEFFVVQHLRRASEYPMAGGTNLGRRCEKPFLKMAGKRKN